MKVRAILVILSLLAFVSTSIGGYLYFNSLQESAYREVEKQAVTRAYTIRNHLSSYLQENLKGVRVLAGLGEIRKALDRPIAEENMAQVNQILDHFNWALRSDVCYLMNDQGTTIASTNRDESSSFVGKNYAFRPYFSRAINGETYVYMALGVTSGKRGVYYSHPIYGEEASGAPIGVAVVKATVEPIENEFSQKEEGIFVLSDSHGVIFASNRHEWHFGLLWKLPPARIREIIASRQFGQSPLNWVGLRKQDEKTVVDDRGNRYLLHRLDLAEHPGWSVLYLNNLDLFLERVSHPLIRISGYIIASLCLIVGLAVFVLFRKASLEIVKRRRTEAALRESEETARALLNAPTASALLLDSKGTVVAANETASRALDVSREKLMGSCIYGYFHQETAQREKDHLLKVFVTGKPARYEDRRGSRIFDTSLYPVFNAAGRVIRVAIFSMDITDLKRTEEALRKAKEDLSRYSTELERQVRQRTSEINSILENTPAVVYIKDRDYRYVMVGSKFENLFGCHSSDIKGKTDYEIFPKHVADQFRHNDEKVSLEKNSIQVEERVPLEDGIHTYLSVKFPLKDEKGRIRAMCGISTDITDLKKAQEQHKRLSGKIIASQEQERSAIARELHDELGQLLTALRMDAVWLRDRMPAEDPRLRERSTSMCSLIDKTIDEVRRISIGLRPGVLDDLGLIDALEWYTEECDRRSDFTCLFTHRGIPSIKDLPATAAYRIAQEALTNVARHASATKAEVKIETEDGILVLTVSDDGEGFDTRRLSENDCLGIAGMRERAELAGGSLIINSTPGQGTVVRFEVPISEGWNTQGRRT
jgi:PAS domain S-box-containing protein